MSFHLNKNVYKNNNNNINIFFYIYSAHYKIFGRNIFYTINNIEII